MFQLNERIVVCNLSNFTLGVDVAVIENERVLNRMKANDLKSAIQLIYGLCETQCINNVFVKPLAPESPEKILGEFKAYGKTNFSKTVDRIHFHVI